ncbi:MAG: hypothetical protein A2X86_20290 [Bdellovibrionales bacterium GWA2_49_15]|nr:MAG: hypothetical protein A2X86_20290 [Bdellovibrionales bacterium GWA2_49_15]HAZ11346.1 hypothetical protein [Bdellovibrionales bacterium]
MKVFLSVLVFFGLNCFAATNDIVTLDMALKIDGRLVSKPNVKVLFGKTATVEQTTPSGDGTFIEVLPTKNAKNQVIMKFKVGKIVAGKREVLSRPQVTTLLDQRAEITQESIETSSKSISLSVTPSLWVPALPTKL